MTAIHRALEHRTRAFVALLVIALAAVTLAACGGGDDGGDGGSGGGGDAADARTILRETFSGTHEIRSADVDLRLALAEAGGEQFAFRLSGPFQNEGDRAFPRFDIELDANLGSQGGQFRAGVVSTSDRLFVEWMGETYEVPAELIEQARTSFEQQADAQRGTSLASFGIDPQSWIEDPQVVGQEDVGGTETDHISGTLSVSAFLDSVDKLLAEVERQGLDAATGQDVPDSIPAEDRAEIERAIRNASVDIWSGSEDRTLRKLQVGLDIAPPEERGGTADFVLQLSGVNEEQTIEAPANARPIDELLGQLQGLLGGSGLGGGDADLGGDFEAYQDCLVDARGDLAAAQRCESLLR